MPRSSLVLGSTLALVLAGGGAFATRAQSAGPLRFTISFPAARSAQPLDGRVLLFISDDGKAEPRMQTDQYRANSTKPIFGVDVDGLKPGAGVSHRRHGGRMAGAESQGHPARRLLRPGADQPLRDVPSRRRPHHQDADGPGRRTALGIEAGQLLQHAGEDAPRRGERRRDPNLDGPGDPADRAADRHRAGEVPAGPERAADEVLGPADVSRRDRVPAAGLGRPTPTRAIRC